MKIFVGADYRGLAKKNLLAEMLMADGYEVVDEGAYEYSEEDDFNEPAIAVARAIRAELAKKEEGRRVLGILICDSAHGVTIQANRFKLIRAANCDSEEAAKLAREHDNANILCLSAHFLDEEAMYKIAKTFIKTDFTALERRVRRIKKLDEVEDD